MAGEVDSIPRLIWELGCHKLCGVAKKRKNKKLKTYKTYRPLFLFKPSKFMQNFYFVFVLLVVLVHKT